MPEQQADRFILTLSCQDRMGIVADVSRFLFEHRCNIVDSAQFGDPDNGLFFMRTSFQSQEPLTRSRLDADFLPIREKFAMNSAFHIQGAKLPTLVLVSKFGHCLNDLLYRHRIGALPVDIRAIVSNHPDFADVAETAKIPFHHLPVTAATKAAQEAALFKVAQDALSGLTPEYWEFWLGVIFILLVVAGRERVFGWPAALIRRFVA